MRFNLLIILTALLLLNSSLKPQSYKIVESNSQKVVVQFYFSYSHMMRDTVVNGERFSYFPNTQIKYGLPGYPWIPDYLVNVGIPYNTIPKIRILSIKSSKVSNKLILPLPDSLGEPFHRLKFDQKIYGNGQLYPQTAASNSNEFIYRYARVLQLHVAPVQYNPLSREILYNNSMRVEISFQPDPKSSLSIARVSDKFTSDFLKTGVVNHKEALNFIGKIENLPLSRLDSTGYWYNPQKNYFKIYLKRKGLYRITYDWLVQHGVPANNGLQNGHLEIVNNGIELPLDIEDVNGNGIFDSGDYFQFIGDRPQPTTPYTYLNIYNYENVYWFSYQADTVYKYNSIDGYPHEYYPQITSSPTTLHYEKDQTYFPLGHAHSGNNRDYWLWSNVEARNHQPYYLFRYYIYDSLANRIDPNHLEITVRAYLQALTTSQCSFAHDVILKFNGYDVDEIKWGSNYQDYTIGENTFPVTLNASPDTIPLNGGQNIFIAEAYGNNCDTAGNDQSMINWFEIDYWRQFKVDADSIIFKSPPNIQGNHTFKLWNWYADNMKIFIPSSGEMITNPYITFNSERDVYFNYNLPQNDTGNQRTEYYCYANNIFFTPDSIKPDISSDLRNTNNGADYIIITHPKFITVAQRLENFRSHNLNGISNPRVKIVDINDIYDEFSYGLLDPYALQYFVKYAFENWSGPAPAYVVLIGDMSHDYRPIYSSSKPSYIPSIPYQVSTFGQAQSDNLIVAVSGNDLIPDLAIGRISCETVNQGNIQVDKIINYPADNSKEWKENVLLLASGLSDSDEISLGFNNRSNFLATNYLLPYGYNVSRVYNFPHGSDIIYRGSGPEMRQQIDKGAVFLNYYGHGGGGQWDLVFHDDDIYELHNGDRQPVVSSVTCYTAHFDDQDCFGEIFDRVENKGSVGFIGSSALTWWPPGADLDEKIFNQIYVNKIYTIGEAFLNAKNQYGGGDMTIVSTLLGDPALKLALPIKPDFTINSSDISFTPLNPLKNDTVNIKVKIHNLGLSFPDTSVYVQIFKNIADTSNMIKEFVLPSFGEIDSVSVPWVPNQAGLYNIIVQVNKKDPIDEEDPNDNTATSEIAVFDFGEPNIIGPLNGFFTNQNKVNFRFWDIGPYFNKNFKYIINIDTTTIFNSNFKITSPVLTPQNGILNWQSGTLPNENYFWKATIFDNADTNTSSLKTFAITNQTGNGYLAVKKQLKLFTLDNTLYSDSLKSLILNTSLLLPHPDNSQFRDSIVIPLTPDSTKSTTFATNGTYIFYGDLSYFNSGQPTKIYKVGTGNNGTIKGQNYGSIPNLFISLRNQIFCYSDGFIYAPDSSGNDMIKINPTNGDTTHIVLPVPLLKSEYGILRDGDFYTASDGRYVYNVSNGHDTVMQKYSLRVYDPQNNWNQVGSDVKMNGSSAFGFSSFFVVNGYLFTYEDYNAGYLRRYKISDGSFEEEWPPSSKLLAFSVFLYDWTNNFVYGLRNVPFTANKPGFYKFLGTHQQANGTIISQEIGPAYSWQDISYNMNTTGSLGHYAAYLFGKNKYTNNWDTLKTNLPPTYSLSNVDAKKYMNLKVYFSMVDSALGSDEPMKLTSVKVDYIYPAEIGMFPSDITLSQDTLLQGYNDDMKLKVHNYGYTLDDSVLIKFYLNDSSYTFYSKRLSIPSDSTKEIDYNLSTDSLVYTSGISTDKIKAVASTPYQELFSFNNIIQKNVYVVRDSTKPVFDITFDGKHIINGDVVRSNPVIVMTLTDNSPLQLDTSFFSIVLQNKPLYFSSPDIEFTRQQNPTAAVIKWTPKLPDTTYTLAVLAKDASGNFFDSTAYQITFKVASAPTLENVFNYPNPFKSDTYFTCEFGSLTPEEFYIKIYTIAGRLIRDIKVPVSGLVPGFNKIYWNGLDQDGDRIANGVYIYKVVAKIGNEVKTVIQKLAKVQ